MMMPTDLIRRPRSASASIVEQSRAIAKARTVALPDELWEVRALLDTHMFGRDNRVHRDDVVRVARQIDRMSDGT
jgi:hypothetical protein